MRLTWSEMNGMLETSERRQTKKLCDFISAPLVSSSRRSFLRSAMCLHHEKFWFPEPGGHRARWNFYMDLFPEPSRRCARHSPVRQQIIHIYIILPKSIQEIFAPPFWFNRYNIQMVIFHTFVNFRGWWCFESDDRTISPWMMSRWSDVETCSAIGASALQVLGFTLFYTVG